MPDPRRTADWGRVFLWAARVAWLIAALLGGVAIGAALAERSGPVQVAGTLGCWAGFAVGAVALGVPSVPSLTVVRVVVPASVVVAVVTAFHGADLGEVLRLGVPTLVATALVLSADVGRRYVEASAYGDEQRFPVRPPYGYLAATLVTWAAWVAAVMIGPLAWTAGVGWPGLVLVGLAVALTWLLPPRWHQLSRRWLVIVPAGLVVHDPVTLAETLALPRRRITGVGAHRGPRSDTMPDLSGPTPGVALAIRLDRPVAVVPARRPGERQPRPVRAAGVFVTPSRPGAALRAMADRFGHDLAHPGRARS